MFGFPVYKTTEGQYSPVRLELARLVSSLLYGTRVMFVCFLLKRTSGHLNSKGFLRVFLMTRATQKEQATKSSKIFLLEKNIMASCSACLYRVNVRRSKEKVIRIMPYFAMGKLKYSEQGRQKPFSEFQQVAAVETCEKFSYKSSLKPCLYIQHDLRSFNLFSNS